MSRVNQIRSISSLNNFFNCKLQNMAHQDIETAFSIANCKTWLIKTLKQLFQLQIAIEKAVSKA